MNNIFANKVLRLCCQILHRIECWIKNPLRTVFKINSNQSSMIDVNNFLLCVLVNTAFKNIYLYNHKLEFYSLFSSGYWESAVLSDKLISYSLFSSGYWVSAVLSDSYELLLDSDLFCGYWFFLNSRFNDSNLLILWSFYSIVFLSSSYWDKTNCFELIACWYRSDSWSNLSRYTMSSL